MSTEFSSNSRDVALNRIFELQRRIVCFSRKGLQEYVGGVDIALLGVPFERKYLRYGNGGIRLEVPHCRHCRFYHAFDVLVGVLLAYPARSAKPNDAVIEYDFEQHIQTSELEFPGCHRARHVVMFGGDCGDIVELNSGELWVLVAETFPRAVIVPGVARTEHDAQDDVVCENEADDIYPIKKIDT